MLYGKSKVIVNVKNTIKNIIMVFSKNGSVSQSVITLNSGMMMKAEYIQKEEENKANIHLINGSVLLNVDRDSISYDKDANNKYIQKMNSGEMMSADTASSVQDDLPTPAIKRRGCCGR